MNPSHDSQVRLIPIDQIHIINPRSRGRAKFDQIAANIASVGLKKPVIVTPRTGEKNQFDLVCGQGRLESYKLHGQSEIPAIVIQVTREEALLMSLAENLARRKRTSLEMARELVSLEQRGYKVQEIAKKVALDPAYVRGLLKLMKKGEERLLVSVENRRVPLSVAIQIAETDDGDLQKMLTSLYESKQLRGASLEAARRLIESRRHGKHSFRGRPKRVREASVTSHQLVRAFKDESERQQAVIERARVCETRLRFIITAIKKLLANDGVVNLLRAEQLTKMPQYLADELSEKARKHAS